MKLRITFLILIIILIQTNISFSQENWSLEKCISYALDKNITIKQQELYTKSYEVNKTQSILNLLPSVNASGAFSSASGRALDQSTYQFTNQTVNSINAQLNGNLTIFSGLQKINTIRQNRYNKRDWYFLLTKGRF